ncbi:hypothetical protein FWH30_01560 [Microgenomates group bacterium]|nr:hypothetical protein [Microgenomates group bacterium]
MKKWSLLLGLFSILCFFAPSVRAQGDVFIISQVRGDEQCCQPGSASHLSYQLEQLQNHNFSGSFIFRYDALLNDEMVTIFHNAKKLNPNLTAGLWIEVTPSLAAASGVTYRGNEKNWSKAEHSLLVGYASPDRKLLLDVLIKQFHQSFPDEPLLVAGAWGIDSDSLNYLEQQGLRIWQTVREQWGVDSYTVNGSKINKPYFPSSNWYLSPSNQPRNLIVIKHTISDPLWNYGDTTSSFTSQPNDFVNSNLTVADYFVPLLDQALMSVDSQRGWATIGLESSMDAQFQLQFGEQLSVLANKMNSGEARVVGVNESINRFITHKEATKTTVSLAQDLLKPDKPLTAFWVETTNYRLRFRLTSDSLVLDDVRVYDDGFPDPYNDYPAQNGFYGIIPPIFSTQFSHKPILRGGDKTLAIYTISPDDNPQIGMVFPSMKIETLKIVDQLDSSVLTYLTHNNQEVRFIFEQDKWISNIKGKMTSDDHWPWQNDDYTSQQIVSHNAGEYVYSYSTKPDELSLARQNYKQLLFPEVTSGKPDAKQSFFDWRNPYTLAGILPSRLVFYPLDSDSFPVLPTDLKVITNPEVKTTISEQMGEYLFIDFDTSSTQKVKVDIYFGEELANKQHIYFISDCRNNWRQCGLNPVSWWRYLRWKMHQRSLAADH